MHERHLQRQQLREAVRAQHVREAREPLPGDPAMLLAPPRHLGPDERKALREQLRQMRQPPP